MLVQKKVTASELKRLLSQHLQPVPKLSVQILHPNISQIAAKHTICFVSSKKWLWVYSTFFDESLTLDMATMRDYRKQWLEAVKAEMNSQLETQT